MFASIRRQVCNQNPTYYIQFCCEVLHINLGRLGLMVRSFTFCFCSFITILHIGWLSSLIHYYGLVKLVCKKLHTYSGF